MKYFTFSILILFSSLTVSHASPGLFDLNEEVIDKKFEGVTLAESIIKEKIREGKPATALKNEDLTTNFGIVSLAKYSDTSKADPPLGIGGFWWGFSGACLGNAASVCFVGPFSLVVGAFTGLGGVAFVYIETEKDKKQTANALWGCLAGNGFTIFLYALAVLFFVGIAEWSY